MHIVENQNGYTIRLSTIPYTPISLFMKDDIRYEDLFLNVSGMFMDGMIDYLKK